MAAPAILDIELSRNIDWQRGFTIKDEEGEPVDLTGTVFDFDIRYVRGVAGAPLIDIPVNCEEPETGFFDFTLHGAAFDNFGNKFTNSQFVYDLVGIQDGVRIPLLKGTITLFPGVSDHAS